MSLHLALPEGAVPIARPIRASLPARRKNETQDLTWSGKVWTVTVGFDEFGLAREIFADGSKVGSEMEALLDDACILVSMLLQSGWHITDLVDRLSREATDPDAPAASILGLLMKVTAQAELRHREGDA